MSNNLARLDPRAARTRIALRDALMGLIIERQAYDGITIRDIADRADVSRSTFYLHFSDVDELMFETMRDVYLTLWRAAHNQAHEYELESAHDFEHVAEYADFYRVMIGERGSPAFVVRVRSFLAGIMMEWLQQEAKQVDEIRVPLEMIAYFMAGAQIGIIAWWLQNDMQLSPEEMAQALEGIGAQGITWALPPDLASGAQDQVMNESKKCC